MNLLNISIAPVDSIEPDDLVRFELHSCVLIHILNSSVDNFFLFNDNRLQNFEITWQLRHLPSWEAVTTSFKDEWPYQWHESSTETRDNPVDLPSSTTWNCWFSINTFTSCFLSCFLHTFWCMQHQNKQHTIHDSNYSNLAQTSSAYSCSDKSWKLPNVPFQSLKKFLLFLN